jgi:hypothetical protein
MSEKNKDFEKKAMEFVKKYPLTEEEAFDGSKTNPFIADEVGQGMPIRITPKKFKKIDEGVYAYEIPKSVGCIVKMAEGVVFVPEAAITAGEDGTFDLIRAKRFVG